MDRIEVNTWAIFSGGGKSCLNSQNTIFEHFKMKSTLVTSGVFFFKASYLKQTKNKTNVKQLYSNVRCEI